MASNRTVFLRSSKKRKPDAVRAEKRSALIFAVLFLLVLLTLPIHAHAQSSGPAFTGAGPLTSDAGNSLIEWTGADVPVALEIARSPDFADARPLYQGRNRAYFVSGLADGEYFLRLRGQDGALSEPLELIVVHQSLQRALWLALIGALVTLAIVATIFVGVRDE